MNIELLNDRYQIIRTLGAGGFGETFLAEDTQMPSRRRCVVKRLHPVEHNPQINQLVQARFQREAAILEDLGSGSGQIPTLYAYFYHQIDRQFYLVQEWIDGETLQEIVSRQERLADTEVRRILIAILPVFNYIHGKFIIHRDVKPDNIILRHRDRQPVLIDFGAVRETIGTALAAQSQPTKSITIGTPGYMSSEQSVGRAVYSSDLYSLGMTAIYLLTGKESPAFATDPQTADLLWREAAPQVSTKLANILDRAIATHPRDRFQTAEEFLTALQDVPTLVVAPTTTQFVRQRPHSPVFGTTTTQFVKKRPFSHHPHYLLFLGCLAMGGVALVALLFSPQPPEVTTDPPLLPTTLPPEQDRFPGLPRLKGMATVEMKIEGKLIAIEVDGNNAPISAGNFVDLVHRGFYNGLTFHRVVRQPQPFIVQGGDPTSTGNGGFQPIGSSQSRYIPLEVKSQVATTPIYNQEMLMPPRLPHKRGVVALARSTSLDSASSQFYFALADLPVLDGKYAVFGKIIQGLEVIDTIKPGDQIDSARVIKGGQNLHKP